MLSITRRKVARPIDPRRLGVAIVHDVVDVSYVPSALFLPHVKPTIMSGMICTLHPQSAPLHKPNDPTFMTYHTILPPIQNHTLAHIHIQISILTQYHEHMELHLPSPPKPLPAYTTPDTPCLSRTPHCPLTARANPCSLPVIPTRLRAFAGA